MTDDIDELVKALTEKWVANAVKPSALAVEDRGMAAKLLGPANARRLASTPRGAKFRYLPPVYRGEFYFHKADYYLMSGWTVRAYRDGKLIFDRYGLDDAYCNLLVAELRRRGIPVQQFKTEAMAQATPVAGGRRGTKPQRSERFAIMEKLRGYRR